MKSVLQVQKSKNDSGRIHHVLAQRQKLLQTMQQNSEADNWGPLKLFYLVRPSSLEAYLEHNFSAIHVVHCFEQVGSLAEW